MLADNTIVDATPVLPGDNVTYEVGHPISTRLLIKWGNTDITDKTNVVWVGEKMDLRCVLDWEIAPITNYLWRVDGRKIKDWVVSGTGTNATTAEVIAWGYDSNRTSAITQFIWVEPSPSVTVACTVQVAGETLVAQTKFEVRKPEAKWILTPKWGQVNVMTGVCDLAGTPDPFYWLTTGRNCDGTNELGMHYGYEITDLKGYTNSFEVSWVQIAQIDWLRNHYLDTNMFQSSEKHTKGVDTEYPYSTWGQSMANWDRDTPRSQLAWTDRYWWRKDQFEAYLLWKPTRGPSIPVPLKVATWNWQGKTGRVNTNTPPVWVLHPLAPWPRINPQAAVGVDVYSPPQWTNNIRFVPWQYNNTAFYE